MRRVVKAIILIALLAANFMGLWWLLYSLGMKSIPPIGAVDQAGPVIPPKWFIVPVAVLVLIEYGLIDTLLLRRQDKRQGSEKTSEQ